MNSNTTSYTVKADIDENGDIIIPLPQEVLNQLNLKEGDTVEIEEKNGSVYIKPKKKLFAIERLVSFKKMTFIQGQEPVHASDEVVCNENLHFFQKSLPIQPISVSEVSIEEAVDILIDQEYCNMSDIKSNEMFLQNLVNKEV